jgi:cytosine deaminase
VSVLLVGATIEDGSTVDVRLDGERVAAVGQLERLPTDEVHDLAGYLLLPAPAEPHAHLDKAYTADRVGNVTGDLIGAIVAWQATWPTLTHDDIVERARRAVLAGVANGLTAIRTHGDLSSAIGLRSMEALVDIRQELRDLVDIQVVALVALPTAGLAGAEHRALLRDALEMGVDIAGGCPHLDDDRLGCLEACLEAAAEAGRPIDLHTDETLNPEVLGLREFAALVARTGFPHGATASHCVSLGMQDEYIQKAVAAEVAEAGVAVITLPQTNLYLQGHGHGTATPRGLTALRALLDAGVTVAGGGDNVQDPFNAMGRADPLETASLLVTVGHLLPSEAYDTVSRAARAAMGLEAVTITAGAPAELLAVRASTLREAIATGPPDRFVFHKGRLVARTRATTEFGRAQDQLGYDTERSHD